MRAAEARWTVVVPWLTKPATPIAMAIRWSSKLSTEVPASGRLPTTAKPSENSSTSPPSACRFLTVAFQCGHIP